MRRGQCLSGNFDRSVCRLGMPDVSLVVSIVPTGWILVFGLDGSAPADLFNTAPEAPPQTSLPDYLAQRLGVLAGHLLLCAPAPPGSVAWVAGYFILPGVLYVDLLCWLSSADPEVESPLMLVGTDRMDGRRVHSNAFVDRYGIGRTLAFPISTNTHYSMRRSLRSLHADVCDDFLRPHHSCICLWARRGCQG